MTVALRAQDPAVFAAPGPGRSFAGAGGAVAIYRMLSGVWPAEADITDDHDFDRHVLACILSAAASEERDLSETCGLSFSDLIVLVATWFPHVAPAALVRSGDVRHDEESELLQQLLLARRSTSGDTGRWLAAMVARRSMEPNHLWEDLGLRERPELTRLLTRHFAPLASRNTRNMKWKRFFYRSMCEDDGFVMCTTPVCTQCADFDMCFGEETGESRMAALRRDAGRAAMATERAP